MAGNAESELRLGETLAEGKTKVIRAATDHPGQVYLVAKDAITAHNGVRKGQMEGKGVIASATCAAVFRYLETVGIRTAFVEQASDNALLCRGCDMVPIEWVTRRVATGSFLKRNPGVKEGYRFTPPKQELFFKDDAQGDPQWSEEQVLAAEFTCAGVRIGPDELRLMHKTTLAVFTVLEKLWASLGVALIDMKIEFGVDKESGDILVADVIDNDSWRLWPAGDKRLMKDKQTFRDAETVTPEVMLDLKKNYQWVADQLASFNANRHHLAVIIMGSPSDAEHCAKIRRHLTDLGISTDVRVSSAHKTTEETLRIVAEYEGGPDPVVFIAVAGRSNGLGPVLSGNTAFPVINCPPAPVVDADVFSSLRTPSGLGCSTVLYPEAAALAAAAVFGMHDPTLWSRLAVRRLTSWCKLNAADVGQRTATGRL
ncbi:multifunctional protein ADE2-like [Amphibalanus amphitrite]|uniref:multifunctional protein ADE2-like n=1 Tax=Amphibalanus amphitrite TaxID=1232801 RepID=UPI001C91A532|nr:multifunctional protein ADE2-like [Amphibalanus amphitrite]